MNNQEIIDNAPEGSVCIDANNDYFNAHGVMWSDYCKDWDFHDNPEVPIRSLADIKRIVELENIMFDLLSLSSFAMSFPFEYEKLEALKEPKL